MSGNIYWRGRSKAIKSKKEKVVEVKKKKERSLTQKIRDAKRLLAKPDLPEDLRKEKQVLLEGLERMRNEQLLHEKERKFAKMYHKVKFFERQKLTRRIKQIRKDLLKIEEAKAKGDSAVSEVVASLGDNQEGLNQKLEKYQGDLKYILNFPNSEKYISILKDIKDPIVLEKRNSIRHQIFSQPNLRTGESDEEDEEMGLGEEFDEEEEEEEERGNGNKKRKEKFVWQPDAKKGGNKTAKRNAPKSRHEEAEADDEDDKEEVEKKQMKKPPRKKSRIEPESTSTDPQEYGDDIPTLEKDDFFLTGTTNTKSVAGEGLSDVAVKEGRKRQRSDGNKKTNEKNNVKKQKSNNISSNNTKKTPKEEPRGKKNPVKPAVQKEASKPQQQQQQQKTQPTKEKQAASSPKPKPKAQGTQSPGQPQLQKGNGASPAKGKTEGSRSPRQQQQQKKNTPSTPKGQKRKLEIAEDDNKVEELPSRRKRRSGGGFDLPTPTKGEKEVSEKADTPKQKLHIRFD